MKATKTITRVSAILLALSLLATTASAEMLLHGMGKCDVVRVQAPGMDMWAYAGEIEVTYDDYRYLGYCVDLYQPADSCEVDLWSSDELHNGDLVACLFETYAADVCSGTQAAALQVAIWEILNEDESNGFDVKKGDFRALGDKSIRRLANDMLDDLPDEYQPHWNLGVLHSDVYQDILVGGPCTPVPEPATAGLVLFGGLLTVLRKRRHR